MWKPICGEMKKRTGIAGSSQAGGWFRSGLLGLSGGRLKMRRNGGTVMASLAKGEGELEGLAEMGEELDEEGGLIEEREGVVAGCV